MNDLKTLYNARSNKDELAEVAEKLGIEDKSLASILKELAGGERGGEIPVITSEDIDVQLSSERAAVIATNSIIKYDGKLFSLCTDKSFTNTIMEAVAPQGSPGWVYLSNMVIVNGDIDGYDALVAYINGEGYTVIMTYSM